ncbi:MAG: FkbM family methyltransferase [Alphaproteobacteria bacterium]
MAKFRQRLIRKIFSSLKGRHYHWRALAPEISRITRDCGDHIITFDPTDIIGRHLYTFGHWQRDDFDLMMAHLRQHNLLKPGKAALELGANIGTQTIYMHLSGCFDKVVAVEADPQTARLLDINIADNGFSDRTHIVAKAIGAENGTATFYQSEKERGRNSLLAKANGSAIDVPMVTLETLFADCGVAADDIGFVWLDLEGFEFEVMQQIVAVLPGDVPIFTEFSPQKYGVEKTDAFVELIRAHYTDSYQVNDGGFAGPMATADLQPSQDQVDLLLFNQV